MRVRASAVDRAQDILGRPVESLAGVEQEGRYARGRLFSVS
jgi:hypothetical protein